ncbi:hypothetical protein KDC22_03715 [Paenibacillus tritici]|uniref:hypothetical protein n=1 Tax=Paenibacillus tritici TaxID=1873425 RepID=UPI001BAC52FC|nr:hypothetical protein [Paenibacillus tritici]QUL55689.1 hypothetical protein KDC22_03715 [Paenibacillus tritici]
MDTAIGANKPFRAAVRQQQWTLERGTDIFARYIDDVLYQNGVYLSPPDLFYRVVDRWEIMLLGVVGVIFVFLLKSSLGFSRI